MTVAAIQTPHHHASPWLLGSLAGLGVLTIAPYALPALGIGGTDGGDLMHFIGAPSTPDALGTGLAGNAQQLLANVPGIGSALTSATPTSFLGMSIASGALVSLAATAIIGLGGVWLANRIEKNETGDGIRWSKVIRTAALATSILIALPSLIGAISVGVTFLASMFGIQSGTQVALAMRETLGATSLHASGALSGMSALLPHFIACGAAALPLIGSLFVHRTTQPKPTPRIELPARMQDRIATPGLRPISAPPLFR